MGKTELVNIFKRGKERIRKKCPQKEKVKETLGLARAGVSGFNKPKRTPNHPKKSHIVVAKEGNKIKL